MYIHIYIHKYIQEKERIYNNKVNDQKKKKFQPVFEKFR